MNFWCTPRCAPWPPRRPDRPRGSYRSTGTMTMERQVQEMLTARPARNCHRKTCGRTKHPRPGARRPRSSGSATCGTGRRGLSGIVRPVQDNPCRKGGSLTERIRLASGLHRSGLPDVEFRTEESRREGDGDGAPVHCIEFHSDARWQPPLASPCPKRITRCEFSVRRRAAGLTAIHSHASIVDPRLEAT